MSLYAYETQLVISADVADLVVGSAEVAIYDPSDTAMSTPLALVDTYGLPLPNPMTATAQGFIPAFQAPLPQVMWAGGGYMGYLNSFQALLDAATQASTSAAEAQAEAAASAVQAAASASVATPAANWAANTAYAAGHVVVAPDGNILTAKAAFTSGVTFDASKWNTPSLSALVAGATAEADTVERTNLMATPGFENGIGSWTDGANSTFGTSAAQKYLGTQSLAVTRSNATAGGVYARGAYPVTAGATYTVSAYVYGGAGAANTYTFRAGGAVSSPTVTFTPSNSWQRLSVTGTATSTGTGFVYITDDNNAAPVSGTVFYVDAVLVEASATLGAYFDGDTPLVGNTYHRWTGTAGQSTSLELSSGTLVKRDAYGNFLSTLPLSANAVANKAYVDTIFADGDTGWLTLAQIGASLNTPLVQYDTASTPLIRRIGNRVLFEGAVKGLPASPSAVTITTLPADWRPVRNPPCVPLQRSSNNTMAGWAVGSSGVVSMDYTTNATAGSTSWYPFQLTWLLG